MSSAVIAVQSRLLLVKVLEPSISTSPENVTQKEGAGVVVGARERGRERVSENMALAPDP